MSQRNLLKIFLRSERICKPFHGLDDFAREVSAVFIPPAPAPLVAPRNIVPAGEKELFESAPAVTPLLMLRRPAARVRAGAFRPERGCSLGEWR